MPQTERLLGPACLAFNCCYLRKLISPCFVIKQYLHHRQINKRPCKYENKQRDALYRLIYYSKSALHVSGGVFAHHQEHLTVYTVSSSVHPSCCRLPAGSNLGEHYQIHLSVILMYINSQNTAVYSGISYQ